jgi:hypothetical protein
MLNITQGSATSHGHGGRKRGRSTIEHATQSQARSSQSTSGRGVSGGSTYRQISDFAQKLRLSTKVTERRLAGKELLRLLSDVRTRQKLLREAGGKQTALSAVYQMILRNATYAAELVTTSSEGKSRSTKVQPDDVTLPYKLLRRIVSDSSGGGGGGGSNEINTHNAATSTTYREDPGLLPPNEVAALLKFCLDMLNYDPAKAAAETELLDMLSFLCSQPEYVVSAYYVKLFLSNP